MSLEEDDVDAKRELPILYKINGYAKRHDTEDFSIQMESNQLGES